MRGLRRILHSRAAGHTDQWVREFVKVPTIGSVLQARRVHWLTSLLSFPDEHKPLLAMLSGTPVPTGQPSLFADGTPSQQASPWLRQ
eukprot:14764188-Heterocapsa_arctica.AAC.1